MNSNWSETPLANFLRVAADLLGANLLFLACCIPVVTIGPALSAMYAVVFHRERNDGAVAVIPTFFKALKQNFWKAMVLELVIAALIVVTVEDFWYAANLEGLIHSLYVVVGTIMALLTLILFVMSFAQQSIYQNTIKGYLKHSFLLAFCAPVQLLLALAAWVVPWALVLIYPDDMIQIGALYLMWGFSFPAWATAKLLNPVFAKTKEE